MGIHRFDDRLAACDERSAAEKDVPTRGKYAEEEWTEKQLEEKVRQGGEEGIPAGMELDKVRENWAKQEEKWAKQAEREKEEERRREEEAKEHREFCKQPDVKCKNP